MSSMESKTDTVTDDLQARLNKVLETKVPGTSTSNAEIPKNSYWDASESDFKQETKKPPEVKPIEETTTKKPPISEEKEETAEVEEEEPTPGSKKKIKPSDDLKLGSAKTACGTLELTIKMIAVPLINYKFKKKFTVNEINRLDRVSEVELDQLADEDKALRKKWDKLMDQRDKKKAAADFTPERREELINAWKNYFDYTETTMSPMYYVVLASFNAVVGTITDIALE